ncbi:MAG TPA: SCO family protein [Gemmatimonadales bacterium]|nr:SCO family protein [Gemmatimonadales bacterium]
MEDRIATARAERPGGALIALAAIIVITAAWWALALWPAGAAEPEWLTRTRAACFGSPRGGLPNAGGWILLLGEPAGMLAALVAGWGRSLRRDLAWVGAHPVRRAAALVVTAVLLLATGALGFRVARAWETGGTMEVAFGGTARRVSRDLPAISLIDQEGRRTSLGDLRGTPVMVTFAFGHCATVCPIVVTDLQAARRTANRPDVPLVVITLDPWRDTPERLPTLARHWKLSGPDRVLSGEVGDVTQVLDELAIARRRNETTGDIDHATAVLILDGEGRIAWRVDGGSGGIAEVLAGAH